MICIEKWSEILVTAVEKDVYKQSSDKEQNIHIPLRSKCPSIMFELFLIFR